MYKIETEMLITVQLINHCTQHFDIFVLSRESNFKPVSLLSTYVLSDGRSTYLHTVAWLFCIPTSVCVEAVHT